MNCGNVIYGIGSNSAHLSKLQLGTLDNTSEVEPEVHLWTKSAQQCLSLPDSVPTFERQPANPMEIVNVAQMHREKFLG